MADMTITGDAKFGSIVTEMQKVEKASDSMKRKVDRIGGSQGQQGKSGHQRPGMGLLEVSRGVEDFAVAGMRGLLNNIPGIIMSFGGGMGLAAVVSLAAVGITLFGKSLMDLANPNKKTAEDIKALKDQTEKYSASLVKSKDKLDQFKLSQEAAFRGGIADAADKEMIRRLGDPSGSFGAASKKEQERRAARDRMSALQEERDTLIQGLHASGIKANLHYLPVQNFRYYQERLINRHGPRRGFSPCPVAEEYSRRAISLPIYPDLSTKSHKHVIEALQSAFKAVWTKCQPRKG